MQAHINRLSDVLTQCPVLDKDYTTSWELAKAQVQILFANPNPELYDDAIAVFTNCDNGFWHCLISGSLLVTHFIPRDEWKERFIAEYSDFLCGTFKYTVCSADFIRAHSYLTLRLLLDDVIAREASFVLLKTVLSNIVSNDSTLYTKISSAEPSVSNIFEWLSNIIQAASIDNRLNNILVTENLDILGYLRSAIHSSHVSHRSYLSKLLLVPYIKLSSCGSTSLHIDGLLKCWDGLCIDLWRSGDLDTASIVACALVEALSAQAPEYLAHLQRDESVTIWSFILSCLESESMLVVRKRGAHMLHKLHLLSPDTRGWCKPYIDVYTQLEGCTSMHLVAQVWDKLNDLIVMSSPSPEQADPSHSLCSAPALTFPWIKVLLRCLLSSQQLPIKKSFIRKILSGELRLPITVDSIEWVCYDLLMAMDSPAFFSMSFESFKEEVDWLKLKKDGNQVKIFDALVVHTDAESVDPEDEGHSVTTKHPGVILPLFLGNWIIFLCEQHRVLSDTDAEDSSINRLNYLITLLLSTVCGKQGGKCAYTFKSLSAIKWVFRVFSYNIVQQCMLHAGQPICSIGCTGLISMLTFIKEKFFSMSRIITAQVYQGLVPLLLNTKYSPYEGAPDAEYTYAPVDRLRMFLELYHTIGLRNILLTESSWVQLKRTILDCVTPVGNSDTAESAFKTIVTSRKDAGSIAVCYGIVGILCGDMNSNSEAEVRILGSVTDELMGNVCRLYSTPYMPLHDQWNSIWFLKSALDFLLPIYNVGSLRQGTSTDRDMWVYSSSYSGGGQYLLTGICTSACNIISFVKFALLGCLSCSYSTNQSDCLTTHMLKVNTVQEACVLVDIMCGVLLLSFCSADVSMLEYRSALSVVMSGLNQTTSILKSLRETSAAEPWVLFLGQLIASRLVHSLRCTLYIADQGISEMKREKSLSPLDYDCVGDIFLELHSHTLVRSSTYQRAVVAAAEDSNSGSIVYDICHIYNTYGKFSDEMFSMRWLGISAAVDIFRYLSLGSKAIHTSPVVKYISYEVTDRLLNDAADCMALCSNESISHILCCCKLLVQHLSALQVCEEKTLDVTRCMQSLLSSAWTSCTSEDGINYRIVKLFIQLCFDSTTLRLLDDETKQKYFCAALDLGSKTKPYVVQFMCYRLLSECSVDCTISFPFFKFFANLLIYREPICDDHNQSDEYKDCEGDCSEYSNSLFSVTEYSRVAGIDRYTSSISVRIMLLQFIEESFTVENEMFKTYVRDLIRKLVAMNRQKSFVKQAMVGSEKFGEKLRCWQALCVLSKYITDDLITDIVDQCIATLADPSAHAIRVHVEIFVAAMAQRFPKILLPKILALLEDFNHSQQALSSYFIVLGHLCESGQDDSLAEWEEVIVDVLMPWLTCAAGLSRAIAQLVGYNLLPRVISKRSDSTTPRLYSEVLRFLNENKEAVRLRQKQIFFFRTYDVPTKCTVKGLMAIKFDNWGEHIPDHVLTLLLNAVRRHLLSDEHDTVGAATPLVIPNTIARVSERHESEYLQTKITPFDDLQLTIEASMLTRQRNAVDRKRQDMIVCASMIDKVTNLAGIARTCEIFAVKELVVSDLSVVKQFEFQSISVSASSWLPMREVKYDTSNSDELIRYLREMKLSGYHIVGIEQTGNSMPLMNETWIQAKCVLVLGMEKLGIPLDILQETDICVEIPQLGVTRSLNVHVSAALAIWEVTRKHLKC